MEMTQESDGRAELPQYFGKDLEAMSFAANYHQWILEELRPYLGKSVAEIGAGVGSFSRLILSCPVEHLTSYEPSANMFPILNEFVKSDPRATAINGFFGQSAEADCFDSVIYVNVLEHVEDDQGELQKMRKAVRTGGHVLIFVPALSWLYSNLDRQVGHFRRYHRPQLRSLVQAAGLDVMSIRYFDFAGILPWYVNFVLLKNDIGGGSVAAYDKIVVPVAKWLERIISPPIGKNLLVVAKKI
jgi:SAM-dependent methyltransferase